MHCRYCNRDAQSASGYCPYCGMPYEDESLISDQSEKTSLLGMEDYNDRTIVQNSVPGNQNTAGQKIQYPGANNLHQRLNSSSMHAASRYKSSRKKWILTGVLAVLIAVVGIAGWNWYSKENYLSIRSSIAMVTDHDQRIVLEYINEINPSRSEAVEALNENAGIKYGEASGLLDSLQIDWKKVARNRTDYYLNWCEENNETIPRKQQMYHLLTEVSKFSDDDASWAVDHISESRWGSN